jgi:hypothetical protein
VLARPRELAFDGDRRDRDNPVAAHRAPPFVVHEQHPGKRPGGDRFCQQRAVHIRMAAWLEHDRAAKMIDVLLRPRALGEHRRAFRTRQPFDDQTKRLTGRMGVD